MRSFVRNTTQRLLQGADVPVWYHACYRPPIAPLETQTGADPRRADFVAWYLVDSGAITLGQLRAPARATYRELALVHTPDYLATLTDPNTLGRVFGLDAGEVPVDQLLRTVRLATGGTIAAAREALARKKPALNLLGGFHHAGIARGGGNSAVNDIAVAVAVLRREGFTKKIGVFDLDAHPPDGTADCLAQDPAHWIGSISGSRWSVIEGIDETVLAPGSGDKPYLAALRGLLARAPSDIALAFVVAGGDVLRGDRFGVLGLTLDGARRRDLMVRAHLAKVPSVWLPGGGYSPNAWRVLAGTGLALALGTRRSISRRMDPLHLQYSKIARSLGDEALSGIGRDRFDLSLQDIEADLDFGTARSQHAGPAAGPVPGGSPSSETRAREHQTRIDRLLGFYTAEGLEQALFRYGILDQIERLGYEQLTIAIDRVGSGDRVRLFGRITGNLDRPRRPELLVEAVLDRCTIGGAELLCVAWLTLRHPRARFTEQRPKLPGQDVPGLGLAREASELFEQTANRLGLAGVALSPAHYHVAYAARERVKFVDPARQGRFEALMRDLSSKGSLLEITTAIDQGRVRLNGAVYRWEPSEMVSRPRFELDQKAVEEAREGVRFTLEEGEGNIAPGAPVA